MKSNQQMVQILFNFWNNLNKTSKLLLIAFMIMFLGMVYFGGSKMYYKYKYFKAVEKELKVAKNELKTFQEAEKELISEGQQTTVKAKTKAKSIDKKLKDDEKAIDNSTINNELLFEFLAKHGENTD